MLNILWLPEVQFHFYGRQGGVGEMGKANVMASVWIRCYQMPGTTGSHVVTLRAPLNDISI